MSFFTIRGDRGVVSSIKSRIRVGMCIMQNEKYVNAFEDVHKKAKAFKDHARETNKKDEELREKQAVRDAEPQRSPKTGQLVSPENRPTRAASGTLTPAEACRLRGHGNVLNEEKKQQVLALERLG